MRGSSWRQNILCTQPSCTAGSSQRHQAISIFIYVTSSDDFALEAYGVRAVRYLLKPVREELFIEAMDYAVTDISKEKKETIYTVKTKEGLVSIPYSRIEYIENYSRTLHIR